LETTNHWIGFHFREAQRSSCVGVQVKVRYAGREVVQAIATGGSFRTQHPSTIHFGLGSAQQVDEVEIRWPGGEVTRLAQPPVDRYVRPERPH
jgi:hypothetical protein